MCPITNRRQLRERQWGFLPGGATYILSCVVLSSSTKPLNFRPKTLTWSLSGEKTTLITERIEEKLRSFSLTNLIWAPFSMTYHRKVPFSLIYQTAKRNPFVRFILSNTKSISTWACQLIQGPRNRGLRGLEPPHFFAVLIFFFKWEGKECKKKIKKGLIQRAWEWEKESERKWSRYYKELRPDWLRATFQNYNSKKC